MVRVEVVDVHDIVFKRIADDVGVGYAQDRHLSLIVWEIATRA